MCLVPLVILFLIAETAAWIIDWRTGFHARLIRTLRTAEERSGPVARASLAWPEGSLMVRLKQPGDPSERRWVERGRVFPDHHPDLPQTRIDPDADLGAGRRVFVIGGSAAFGYPYAYEDSFAAQLEARRPGLAVWNAAQIGWASAELVPVAHRIVEHYEPDALVIFCGNNEWVHWAAGAGLHADPARLRLMRILAHSRAIAWLERIVLARMDRGSLMGGSKGFTPRRQVRGVRYALARPLEACTDFDPAQWPVTKRRFLDAYAANLTAMIRAARERGVRVIVMTMPFNYRLSPAFLHPQPLAYTPENAEMVRGTARTAEELVKAEQYEQALEVVREALAAEPDSPALRYVHAEVLRGLGDHEAAESAFAQCRESVVGNLGGVLSINRTIAAVAEREGAELLDVRRLFDDHEHAAGRYFNEGLIHDDCHPTPDGQRIIAEALAGLFD